MANEGNGGLYSKFQQRLRNIRLSRAKKKKFEKENEKYIQQKVQEIHEVVSKEPLRISRKVGIVDIKRELFVENQDVNVEQKEMKNVFISKNIYEVSDQNIESISDKKVLMDHLVLNHVRETKPIFSNSRKVGISSVNMVPDQKKVNDVSLNFKEDRNKRTTQEIGFSKSKELDKKMKGSSKYSYTKSKVRGGYDSETQFNHDEKKEQVDHLGSQIIDRIKNSFEDYLDELDVLMSELYFLEKDQETEIEMKKVKEVKKKIYELIDKINRIIEQYNLYNGNYYIDNLVGIDDNLLMDDMIDYRTLLDSSSDEKKFVREYKALDEFQQLYMNLKVIREETVSLCEKNEDKIEEFNIRDKKYNQIKLGMVKVEDVMRDCSDEIDRQNKYFSDLMEKINKVDTIEYATYRLRGFQDLVGQSLRYMGLMMLAPLRGILPGIATQTMATRRLIGNLYQNLGIERVEHVRYETINYDIELGYKLTDIGYTSAMIDDTLKDIERLRDSFMLQYDSRIPGYDDTLKKIDKIHHYVVSSQNRVEKIKMRLKKSKKLNEEKMIRVRELNEKVSRSS